MLSHFLKLVLMFNCTKGHAKVKIYENMRKAFWGDCNAVVTYHSVVVTRGCEVAS